jgi:oxidoreductase
MKCVRVSRAGGPEVLELLELPKPKLKDGWSLIKVQGFGINHSEIFTRKGLSPSVKFPRVLGIECVGIIEETTAENLEVGQQIISIMGEMGRDFDGGYAEYTLIPNHQIYPVIIKGLDLDSLIALPETYYTAFGAYKNLKIHCNDRVLVRATISGVGIAFAKLLKAEFPNIYLDGSTRNLSKNKNC